MPSQLSYPGVYIEEVASGVRTITGVATSVTAFIGTAARGPTNVATLISSYGDFERTFGGLAEGATLGFAVRDFYLNGGSQAIIVRLFEPAFPTEEARQTALTAAKTQAKTAADAVFGAADTAGGANDATPQKVTDAANGAVTAASAPGKAAAAAATSAAQTVAAAAAEKAAGLAATATPAEIAAAAKAAATEAKAKSDAITAAAGGAQAPVTKARISVAGLTLEAAYEGAWANTLRARVDHDVKGTDAAKLFNLSVYDGATGQVELFRNVSVETGHLRQLDKVLANESRLVRITGNLPGAKPAAHDAGVGKNVWDSKNNPETSTGVDGGWVAADSKPLTSATNFVYTGAETKKEGLYALEQADLFNLLCIPPYAATATGMDVEDAVLAAAIPYCEKRRAMMVLDSPSKWKDKDKARTGIETEVGAASKNAAVFFPRILRPNPLHDNQEEEFATCGAIAGLFARTDTQRGVWKAPAGLDATLTNVPKLSVPLTDLENGELNPLGINCLRAMPAAGRVAWGSRTRVGDDRLASEWKYIPVRRTALYIEESLYRGTQWVVFEPNDEPLWAQVRLNVGAFMHSLFRQGAFQGSTPRDAYFVKCDKETTTQDDINRGVVNILVGFAPLKPAEFVVIKLQQIAGQIQA